MNLSRASARYALVCTLHCAILLCLSAASGLQAQQPPDPQTTIRKRVDLTLLDVVVTDPRGVMVDGLRAKDFEILDEKVPQEIAHFSQDEIPLAIALVVDVSGSMQPTMKPLRKALAASLKSLKSEDRVALFSFQKKAVLRIGLTHNFDSVTQKIGHLSSGGCTDVDSAVYQASGYLQEEAPRARRVIIVVSDMLSTCGGGKPVVDGLTESEATLFGIWVPSQVGEPITIQTPDQSQRLTLRVIWPAAPAKVKGWAASSGGFVIDVHRKEGIQAAVEHLIEMLRKRYTLGFYPNPPGKPETIHSLNVQLKNAQLESALPGAIVTFRNRYRVPPEKIEPASSAPHNNDRN